MLLNITKYISLNVRIGGNRSFCSFLNNKNLCSAVPLTLQSLEKFLLQPCEARNSILYNNHIVRSIATSSQKTAAAPSTSSDSTGGNSTSTGDQQSGELIVQHLNEGIVELQLNRVQGKNALSKKILYEVY
jgi:hypothetical protein